MSWLGFSIIPIVVVFASIYLNRRKGGDISTISLRPNCLLTKYPIVFIHGKKSLFYFGNYWNLVPYYLKEHGYNVIELRLPWRNSERRLESLAHQMREISNIHGQVHVIGDASSHMELQWLQENATDTAKSLWYVGELNRRPTANEWQPETLPIRQITEVSPSKLFFGQNILTNVWSTILFLHRQLIGSNVDSQSLFAHTMSPLPTIGDRYLLWAKSLAEKEHLGHI